MFVSAHRNFGETVLLTPFKLHHLGKYKTSGDQRFNERQI